MGGNAFPRLNLVRVRREDVHTTLEFVVELLNEPAFTLDYAKRAVLGSVGKQPTSGDLDLALNSFPARFVGEENLPVFDLRKVAATLREKLPQGHYAGQTLNSGQVNTALPVAGDWSRKEYVQTDFVTGNFHWLHFSHWSPGLDNSAFKGVTVSTSLGVLAKMRKEYERLDANSERNARVGLALDLENGLRRRWAVRMREGHGLTETDADTFETKVPEAPRFSRLGYVTEPEAVLEMLFNTPTKHNQVDTFEKLTAYVKEVMPEQYVEFAQRFMEAARRSACKTERTTEEFSKFLGVEAPEDMAFVKLDR
jgi:hypothetical protein